MQPPWVSDVGFGRTVTVAVDGARQTAIRAGRAGSRCVPGGVTGVVCTVGRSGVHVFSAYWARPEMYLDNEVRRNISNFALATEDDLAEGLARLQAELDSGAWDRRYGHLRSLRELDLGHRLLIAEPS